MTDMDARQHLAPRPTKENPTTRSGVQVGFNPVAAAVSQFRIVRPVIQEEILQIQATGIRLALIVVLHLGNLILGCHLEILILGLCHTEIAHLVGDL